MKIKENKDGNRTYFICLLGCIEVMRDDILLNVNTKWSNMDKEQGYKLHMKQEVAK